MKKILNILMLLVLTFSILLPTGVLADDVDKNDIDTTKLQKIDTTKLQKIDTLKINKKEVNVYNAGGYYLTDTTNTEELEQVYKKYPESDIQKYNKATHTYSPHYVNGNFNVTYKGYTAYGQNYYSTESGTNKIAYCLEPNKMAGNGSGNSSSAGNAYNLLSGTKRIIVSRDVAYANKNYVATKNKDYLGAGQILVWEDVGAKINSVSGVKTEMNTINSNISQHTKKPSFTEFTTTSSTPVHTLKWNTSKSRYEVTLTDTNGVLDSKFSSVYNHTYSGYHLEKAGTNKLRIWTTDHNAKAVTMGVGSNGKFEFDPAPKGYQTPVFFTTSGQDLVNGLSDPQSIKFGVKIEPALGDATLHKVENDSLVINGDKSNKGLGGAKFGIYDTSDILVDTQVTDSSGTLKTKKLVQGNYYAKEINPPNGYNLNTTKYPFIIVPNQTVKINEEVDIENDVIKGRIDLTKVGDTNETEHLEKSLTLIGDDNKPRLEGAEFGVFDSNNKLVDTIITNKSGYGISQYLREGTYEVYETKAPDNYLINPEIFTVTIDQEGEIVHLNEGVAIIDEAEKKPIKIHKVDENGKNLEGAEFEIRYVTRGRDVVVDKLVTDSNGEATSKPLTYGKYILVETKAPIGYEVQIPFTHFTIDKYDSEEELTFEIKNDLIEGKVHLVKEDSKTSKKLSGAEFKIYDSKSKEIYTLVTDENGEVTSEQLPYGKYTIVETRAPNGYTIDSIPKSFEIIENEKTIEVLALNDEILELASTGQNISIKCILIINTFVILISVTSLYVLRKN